MDSNYIEVVSRRRFAQILRRVRANRTLRSYGRLAPFGRVIVTDDLHIAYTAWIDRMPPMNIHRSN